MKDCKLSEKRKTFILLTFTKKDIKHCISALRDTLGFDKIHTNHLKFDSELLHELLSKFTMEKFTMEQVRSDDASSRLRYAVSRYHVA